MALGVTPTRFQWGVIPPFARAKTVVQFDGIDTDYFTADANAVLQLRVGRRPPRRRRGGDVCQSRLRAGARHPPLHRGAAEGARRAAECARRPHRPGPAAGAVRCRPQRRPWVADGAEGEYTDVDWSRVHEVGKVARKGMRQIFRISAVHVLLTQPFFLSWSFLEAMATECLVVGSDTAPVQARRPRRPQRFLVPFADAAAIAARIVDALEMRVSPLTPGCGGRRARSWSSGTLPPPSGARARRSSRASPARRIRWARAMAARTACSPPRAPTRRRRRRRAAACDARCSPGGGERRHGRGGRPRDQRVPGEGVQRALPGRAAAGSRATTTRLSSNR